MSIEDYKSALRLGQKEYRACVSRGEYPYLQVLDEVMDYADIRGEESLGVVEIPVDRLVGTKTEGRRNAFARNFMPLLEPDTEFATKWSNLCEAHLEEGIREPVVAYELMNRFYVVEGNKRASVLKFFGAASVPGTVKRLIPKRRDTPESQIYYEFLEFYRLTKVNYLWFSQPGRFRQMMTAVRGGPGPWTESDRGSFFRAYDLFRRAFFALGGSKLDMTVGDGLLMYLRLYGYPALQGAKEGEVRANLARSWAEMTAQAAPQPVALALSPAEPQKSLLEKLLPTRPSLVRVAFLHEKSADTSGWTFGHEQGRQYLQKALAGRVETTAQENVTPETCEAAARRAVEEGCQVVFTTTPKLMEATLKAAAEFPQTRFLNCSLNMPHPTIRTYYGRMYEAKFLAGVLAGSMTQTHRIGYAADFPICGSTAAINAFALGAGMVDPRAEVYLEWTSRRDADLQRTFEEAGVDLISYQDLLSPQDPRRECGLYALEDGKSVRLAMTRWNWGKFYERVARGFLDGAWKISLEKEAPKAINYWWGMSAGVVELLYTPKLPAGTRRLLELLKNAIIDHSFSPFAGRLLSQTGVVREEGELSAEEIARMDWLAQNVRGSLPALEELTQEAQKLVAVQGIRREDV